MNVIHPVRVKVACIRDAEEARRAVSFGTAAIGMAAENPSGGLSLAEDEIRAIEVASFVDALVLDSAQQDSPGLVASTPPLSDIHRPLLADEGGG